MFSYLNFKRIFTRKRGWTGILPYVRRAYKFHLLPSISCTGDELQPFPEDWYQHGYIESQQPVTADYVEYDEGSYGDGQQSDEGWVPRWEDDRMGVMEHPIRGTQ